MTEMFYPTLGQDAIDDGALPDLGVSLMIVGDLGTRKTSFACQAPAPVFLSMVAEGHDRALHSYPYVAQDLIRRSKLHDKYPVVFNDQRPLTFTIKYHGSHTDSFNDKAGRRYRWQECLIDVVTQIERHYAAWGIGTVVLDSASYLCRMWIGDVIELRDGIGKSISSGEPISADVIGPPEYLMLQNYLQRIQNSLSKLPLNKIWILNKEPVFEEAAKATGSARGNIQTLQHTRDVPGLVGKKSPIYIPGSADIIIDACCSEEIDDSIGSMTEARLKKVPTYWVTPSNKYKNVRHRFAFAFPTGKIEDAELHEPTFRAIWAEKEVRPWICYGKH